MSEPPKKAEGGDTCRTRRALFASLRNELRTPLNVVISYSEMVLEDLTDAENLCSDLSDLPYKQGVAASNGHRPLTKIAFFKKIQSKPCL